MPLIVNDLAPSSFQFTSPSSSVVGAQPPAEAGVSPVGSVLEAMLRDAGGGELEAVEDLRRRIESEIRGRLASFVFPSTIEAVKLHGNIRTLAKPLEGAITWGREEIELEVPDLHVIVSGRDLTTLQEELFDELDVLYDKFVDAPESELAPSGLELRGKLKELLGE